MSLLRVRNLSVSFTQDGATTRAVKNVSFEVGKGAVLREGSDLCLAACGVEPEPERRAEIARGHGDRRSDAAPVVIHAKRRRSATRTSMESRPPRARALRADSTASSGVLFCSDR